MPFSVDPADLEALTARISGLAGFVRDELDELDRRAASLTQAGWTGPGADAYTDAHATWAAAATDLVAHVSQIEMLTRSAHHHYTVTADMNVRMLRGSQGTSIRRLLRRRRDVRACLRVRTKPSRGTTRVTFQNGLGK
ncbi:WXG100 family type VII secretion target [Rhodococcus sp. RS1C4]